jgi:hypothetical protein
MNGNLYFSHNRANLSGALEGVLPNTKYVDSACGEQPLGLEVSLAIPINLGFPKCRSSSWYVSAFGTTMPKTSVHEYCKSPLGEIEVWFSTNHCWMQHPALDPGPNKCHFEDKLCRSVALAANCRHSSRAYRRNILKRAVFKFGFEESLHLSSHATKDDRAQ